MRRRIESILAMTLKRMSTLEIELHYSSVFDEVLITRFPLCPATLGYPFPETATNILISSLRLKAG